MIGDETSTVLVIAKAPRAGRSKTRLCPPCTPDQAAHLAGEALADTLQAVAACQADRRVLVLDGEPGPWLPPGFELIAQRGDGLDERLAAAYDDAFAGVDETAPTLLIGMDTPQVTPVLLDDCLTSLRRSDAVLGHAADGGWWAIGLHRPTPSAFLGVPMSEDDTGRRQHARLRAMGLDPLLLPTLRDVDRWADALAVAALTDERRAAPGPRTTPGSRFAAAVHRVEATLHVDPAVGAG